MTPETMTPVSPTTCPPAAAPARRGASKPPRSRMRQALKLPALALPVLGFALTLGLLPGTAEAYVGPGAGLTAIGTILALLAAVGLALVGFVWYPVKRMMRRRSAGAGAAPDADAASPRDDGTR